MIASSSLLRMVQMLKEEYKYLRIWIDDKVSFKYPL